MQIRNHAALCREVRGITAGARGERGDVVGEEPPQIRRAVPLPESTMRPGERDDEAEAEMRPGSREKQR